MYNFPFYLQKSEGKHIEDFGIAGLHRGKILVCAKGYMKESHACTLQFKLQRNLTQTIFSKRE